MFKDKLFSQKMLYNYGSSNIFVHGDFTVLCMFFIGISDGMIKKNR